MAFGDPDVLRDRAKRLSLPLKIVETDSTSEPRPTKAGEICVRPVPLRKTVHPGTLDSKNAKSVLSAIEIAWAACIAKQAAALVTAPLHKGIIAEAGYQFSGHTEYLAKLAHDVTPVMLLTCPNFRVALATTHLPLDAVPQAINERHLKTIIGVLHSGLRSDFGIPCPKIAVLGLNPHAGESGHLGQEEAKVIVPTLLSLRKQGIDVEGPLPADTAFLPARLACFDALLAMYHDQGLPVLKFAGFGSSVNVTLGLPVIRTSVDHGTALDLAGTGRVDPSSLETAVDLAVKLAAHRNE